MFMERQPKLLKKKTLINRDQVVPEVMTGALTRGPGGTFGTGPGFSKTLRAMLTINYEI